MNRSIRHWARLIARLPKFSHISSFMINKFIHSFIHSGDLYSAFSRDYYSEVQKLHWLPLSARYEFKILVLVLESKLGVASKYLLKPYFYSRGLHTESAIEWSQL